MGGARAKPASGWKGLCTRILRLASFATVPGFVTADPQPVQTSAVIRVCSNVANPPTARTTLLFLVRRFSSHTTLELLHSVLSVSNRLNRGNGQIHDKKIKHRLLLHPHPHAQSPALSSHDTSTHDTCARQLPLNPLPQARAAPAPASFQARAR